jgi:hypothetical protein
VDELITMTAEEHNIDLKAKFGDLDLQVKPKAKEEPVKQEEEEDELTARLAKLKN